MSTSDDKQQQPRVGERQRRFEAAGLHLLEDAEKDQEAYFSTVNGRRLAEKEFPESAPLSFRQGISWSPQFAAEQAKPDQGERSERSRQEP